jgi:hypothetical protein
MLGGWICLCRGVVVLGWKFGGGGIPFRWGVIVVLFAIYVI